MTGFQSTYRKHHPTESALYIQNNILIMAKGSIRTLYFLDLSTGFNIIDQTIVLDR